MIWTVLERDELHWHQRSVHRDFLKADRLKLGQRICRKYSFFHKWQVEKTGNNMDIPGRRMEEETKSILGCTTYKLLIRTQSSSHT